jgi:heptosyltransferase-3
MRDARAASAPASVLVVALRYFGDVLLSTAATRALRAAWPQARIGMLVFEGTESMLEGNPDLDAVHALPRGRGWHAQARVVAGLWRRYELALVTQSGDRPHLFAWFAARRRIGLVPADGGKRWWKKMLLEQAPIADPARHRVDEIMRLPAALGLGGEAKAVPPTARATAAELTTLTGFDVAVEPFAVLHPAPRRRYKRWHAAGWCALVEALHARGLRVVVTASPAPAERAYVAEALAPAAGRIVDLGGRLSLAQIADLLRHARAYLGPDTAVTHLAAVCGTPTVALYGPTDPRLWGPWPSEGLHKPYERVSSLQLRGNVALVQNPRLACVPCQLEGCDRHRDSRAECLDTLPLTDVLAALDALQVVSTAPAG